MVVTDGKVIRRTWPTASFSFKVEHLTWIEQEAKRRAITKSEVMRNLVDTAKAAQESKAA